MVHELTLNVNDLITFQLYDSSTNTEKIKNRRKSYFFLIAISMAFIFMGYSQHNTFLFYYAVFFLSLVILFYYKYVKLRLKSHYTKHVMNIYKGAINEPFQIEITDEFLQTKDKTGDSIIKLAEISSVSEIPSHYFIKISTGPSVIIPKGSTSLNQEIAMLVEHKNIPYINHLSWKWS